jgi:hypothetical protein
MQAYKSPYAGLFPHTLLTQQKSLRLSQTRSGFLGWNPAREAFVRTLFLAGISLLLNFVALAQDKPKPAYDFSLSREERIKLAESAAPPEVSGKATVYLLERKGYVKVRDGENGFSCLVDRQTPLNLEPTCFDAEGSATTLPTRIFAEEHRAKGESEEQIQTQIDANYKSGKFLPPRNPGIVYMMSDSGVLYIAEKNVLVHIPSHLMFYAPYATDKDIGSPPPDLNMPHLIRAGQPDAYIIVIPGPATHSGH